MTYGTDGDLTGAGGAALLLAYASLILVSFLRIAVDAELLHRHGATLGMGWVGLVAVDADHGGPVGRGQGWGRALMAVLVSAQLAFLGYLWALVDPRRRTLHDLVAGTLVLDARDPQRPAATRWPPRWALPAVVAAAAMGLVACAGAGVSLGVAHSNVNGPLDATERFFGVLAGGAREAPFAASCQAERATDEVGLPARLERERWTGGTDLLETDLRPFDLSATSATVTGALSTFSGPGGERELRPLIVQLRKEEERWRVCEVEIT